MFTEEEFRSVSLVGSFLSPFFLTDPAESDAAPIFDGLVSLSNEDIEQWPFGGQAARNALSNMVVRLKVQERHALSKRYKRLFIGPNRLDAPPWGSVYTDKECVIFGASTLELRGWMQSKGIGRTSGESTPDDHIGLMLSLLSWLCDNMQEAVPEYLADHFLPWAFHYLEILGNVDQDGFYANLGILTAETLTAISALGSINARVIRFYR